MPSSSRGPDRRDRAGAALVCVPGLGLDARAWHPTLDALGGATTARVVTLPGYGLRPQPDDDLSPAALGARLAGEVGDRTVEPLVLAGHSASCQVVLRAALLVPDRVVGVVLVGPTTDPRARSWPALARRWTATAGRERPGQVPYLARTYARTGLAAMRRTMEAARRDDVRETLPPLPCPVLVARGRHDRICPADWAALLARLGPPGSTAATLPAGAHMVPLTHGPDLAALVAGWLGQGPEPGLRPGAAPAGTPGLPPSAPRDGRRARRARWWRTRRRR